jgi:pyroglutamyl-peptidase
MPADPPVILLTGFDGFAGESRNPSWDAARSLRGARIAGHRVAVQRIPTAFARCASVLARAIARHRPRLVLCLGQAGGRTAISLERVAINCIDARIPDNDQQQPVDQSVIVGAPAAYFAALPIKAMLVALRERGYPVEVSNSAGTFVCNALAFHLAHGIATRWPGLRGGLIHIPFAPAQVAARPGVPSMPIELVVDALRVAVRVALTTSVDFAVGAGRED